VALAAGGKKVLCIDCDVGLRNLDISLGLTDQAPLSFLDITEGGYELYQAAEHPLYPNLRFLTAPMNKRPEDMDPEAFAKLLCEARSRFDYIFLDAPAGVDGGFRLVSQGADRFLLVTGAHAAAIRDASRVAQLLELMGKDDVRLVVNRVDKHMMSALKITVDDIMDTAGLPLIGIVQEDVNVPLSAACGIPVAKFRRRSPALVGYKNIAKRIQGIRVPISMR
jgi:septum site-determining protein MinD